MRPAGARGLIVGLGLLLIAAVAPRAVAHPLSQGSLNVVVRPGRVEVVARVTLEEVSVTNMLVTRDPLRPAPSGDADEAFAEHAEYLMGHVGVAVDGTPWAGRVVRVLRTAEKDHASYEFHYEPPAGAASVNAASLRNVELTQSVLTDVQFLPGTSWEASYVVRVATPERTVAEGLLLVAKKGVTVELGTATAAASTLDRGRMFVDYLRHGVMHILTGYDHLLFVTALVLATRRMWDLLKVVTAFTIAHTITLALAALGLVHVSPRLVEPMIAASIVFVAAQNVFWPQQSRGAGRLAAAFFFGLFHGLGFAGGLLDAMAEMPAASKLLAIAAFSLGVEIGHQMIVLPLFAALKAARRTRADEGSRERVSIVAQRFGSAAVSLAGVFYLCVALRESFGM